MCRAIPVSHSPCTPLDRLDARGLSRRCGRASWDCTHLGGLSSTETRRTQPVGQARGGFAHGMYSMNFATDVLINLDDAQLREVLGCTCAPQAVEVGTSGEEAGFVYRKTLSVLVRLTCVNSSKIRSVSSRSTRRPKSVVATMTRRKSHLGKEFMVVITCSSQPLPRNMHRITKHDARYSTVVVRHELEQGWVGLASLAVFWATIDHDQTPEGQF